MVKSYSWNGQRQAKGTEMGVRSAPGSPTKKNEKKTQKPNTKLPKPRGKENEKVGTKMGPPKGPRFVKPVLRPKKHQPSDLNPDCKLDGSPVQTWSSYASQEPGHKPGLVRTVTRVGTGTVTRLHAPGQVSSSLPDPLGESLPGGQRQLTPTSAPVNEPRNPSPMMLVSRTVPDIHSKLLAKLKSNKRRSVSLSNSPSKVPPGDGCQPPPQQQPQEEEEVFCGEGESDSSVGSVSSNSRPSSACSDRSDSPDSAELSVLLRSMFKTCDEFMVGRVPAGKLLDYLLKLVDVPLLSKWKIDELSRLLDPQQDNRYVDEDLFQEVGLKWIEMMMDPDCHAPEEQLEMPSPGRREVTPPGRQETDLTLGRRRRSSLDMNASYGSVEGLGGVPGCSSAEVELENRVSELRYQLSRAGDDYTALQKTLTVQEEANAGLTTELEMARRKIAALSDGLERASTVSQELDEEKVGRSRYEEQCCSLRSRVEQLQREQKGAEEREEQVRRQVEALKAVVEEKEQREAELSVMLGQKEAENARLAGCVYNREEQLEEEREAREAVEERLEDISKDMQRLEVELAVKEEELRNVTVGHSGTAVINSENSSNISISQVHDVCVDDSVFDEAKITPLPSTPVRLLHQLGPSASSTPSSSSKRKAGSIGDEIKQLGRNNSGFPSPLCEKECVDCSSPLAAGGHVASGPGHAGTVLAQFTKEMVAGQTGLAEKL